MTASEPEGRLLSSKSYQSLLGHIKDLVESADAASNEAKLTSTWHIGRRITAARLSQKAGYHNTVIRDLATDSGVSVRILQEAVTFHDAYPNELPDPSLSWSHYRQLMWLPRGERTRLAKAAIKSNWSVRELSTAISELQDAKSPDFDGPLPRPDDPSFLYRATVDRVVDGDTVDVSIDLGFEVTRHQRLRLARVDAPPLESKEGRAARDYLIRTLHSAVTIVLTSERIDLHGRYVAHLFLQDTETSRLECFQSGRYLNAALVAAGHATARRRS